MISAINIMDEVSTWAEEFSKKCQKWPGERCSKYRLNLELGFKSWTKQEYHSTWILHAVKIQDFCTGLHTHALCPIHTSLLCPARLDQIHLWPMLANYPHELIHPQCWTSACHSSNDCRDVRRSTWSYIYLYYHYCHPLLFDRETETKTTVNYHPAAVEWYFINWAAKSMNR